jgi:hypothetical protein
MPQCSEYHNCVLLNGSHLVEQACWFPALVCLLSVDVQQCVDDASDDDMVADTRLRLRQTYPATKVLFLPSTSTAHTDLIAVSSDCLRIWKLGAETAALDRVLDVCSLRLPLVRVIT